MLAAGHDPKVVQYLLGHSSISTTMGYIGLARSLQLRYQMGIDLGAGFVVKDRQAKQSMRKSKEYAVSADGVAKTEFAAAKITHTPRLDDYEEIDPLGGDA
jgi:hypothetical protein